MSSTADTAPSLAAMGIQAVPVGGELAHYAAVAEAQRIKERARDRREWLKTVALVVAVPLALSGWIMREVRPVVQRDIEFVPLMPDGTIASAHRWENLPREVQGDMAMNTLWNYVRLRESYSATGAEYAYRVVSALSDERVRDEYQLAHSPQNPTSPYRRMGDAERVDVSYDSHIDLCPMTGCKPNELPMGYQFRFQRTITVQGRPQLPVFYTAQVRFRRGVEGIDPRQRFTFNGPAVQVTEYVAGTPAGAQPGVPRR